jgi:PEP-CTERM motif
MASIDPFLSISPICDCSGDFNLVLSDGIGNFAPDVPEPSTWAMMLLGFVVLGIAGYRRSLRPSLGAPRETRAAH